MTEEKKPAEKPEEPNRPTVDRKLPVMLLPFQNGGWTIGQGSPQMGGSTNVGAYSSTREMFAGLAEYLGIEEEVGIVFRPLPQAALDEIGKAAEGVTDRVAKAFGLPEHLLAGRGAVAAEEPGSVADPVGVTIQSILEGREIGGEEAVSLPVRTLADVRARVQEKKSSAETAAPSEAPKVKRVYTIRDFDGVPLCNVPDEWKQRVEHGRIIEAMRKQIREAEEDQFALSDAARALLEEVAKRQVSCQTLMVTAAFERLAELADWPPQDEEDEEVKR